ncbi:MAG: hypothetical protein CML14_00540 [Puniceicoccaceae bacterium]|nr:hypothetical protein [Puniceicoccaceae bacterium]
MKIMHRILFGFFLACCLRLESKSEDAKNLNIILSLRKILGFETLPAYGQRWESRKTFFF